MNVIYCSVGGRASTYLSVIYSAILYICGSAWKEAIMAVWT